MFFILKVHKFGDKSFPLGQTVRIICQLQTFHRPWQNSTGMWRPCQNLLCNYHSSINLQPFCNPIGLKRLHKINWLFSHLQKKEIILEGAYGALNNKLTFVVVSCLAALVAVRNSLISWYVTMHSIHKHLVRDTVAIMLDLLIKDPLFELSFLLQLPHAENLPGEDNPFHKQLDSWIYNIVPYSSWIYVVPLI